MTDLVCARSEFKYKMYTMYSIVLDGSYCGAYHAISLIKLLTHLLVSLSFHRMDRQLRHLHFNPWSLYPFFLQSCIYIPPYPFFQTFFDRNVGGQHPRYINCRSTADDSNVYDPSIPLDNNPLRLKILLYI